MGRWHVRCVACSAGQVGLGWEKFYLLLASLLAQNEIFFEFNIFLQILFDTGTCVTRTLTESLLDLDYIHIVRTIIYSYT